MRSTPAASVLCFLLFGIIFDAKTVDSQPKVITRQSGQTPEEVAKLEEDIQKVINQIHFLSSADEHMREYSNTGESFTLGSYYDMLRNLLSLVQSLLTEGSMEEVPRMLVCILSEEEDCGVEAELTKTVSVELVKPLLVLLSSPTLHTCTPPNIDTESFSSRDGESLFSGFSDFQQAIIKLLQSLPLSLNLGDTLSSLVDAVVKNVLKLLVSLLQIPMEYIKIALQLGISVPSLNNKDTCEKGDLKQLIMWGINHNVSWSFAPSLVNILMEVFLEPEQPLCIYGGPGCQNPPTVLFKQSRSEATFDSYDILKCDRYNLAQLNDTLCADLLQGSRLGSSTSVLTLCQALGSLSPNQLQKVWSNMCDAIQMLVSPIISMSSPCSYGDVQDSMTISRSSQIASHRGAREAPNLSQLACNYDVWLETLGTQMVESQFVSLCSDNDRDEFVKQVCTNADLLKELLLDASNSWLYAYCANFSADSGYLVSHFCVYEQWRYQNTIPVSIPLLEFCMNLDGSRLTLYMCQNREFFLLVLAQSKRFLPNCPSWPSPSVGIEFCHYSQWHDLTEITTDILRNCATLDGFGFVETVCSNSTFKNTLLQNEDWLEELCNTTLASQFSNIEWCNYHMWEEGQVDVSVVALCWQNDNPAFQINVCCKTSLLDKLLQDQDNQWLESACTGTENMHTLQKVCKYTDWLIPTFVDMTDVAFCSEFDKHNFTCNVCTNQTVLQNLLDNRDNIWLIYHCANYSKSDIFLCGDGEEGGDPTGFKPAELCKYSTWNISLPSVTLLTFCWENDKKNFVSSLCPNSGLLLKLSQELYSEWVSSMCNFTNYTSETTTTTTKATTTTTTATTTTATTTTTTTTTSTNSTDPEPDFCLARNLVKQFHLNCSADFTSACQPGASHYMMLKIMVYCWVENMEARVEDLLTAPVAAVLKQTLSITMVYLLAVEEVKGPSLPITKNIKDSVLESVSQYLERKKSFEEKKVLLQCFDTVLSSMMQTPNDLSSNELVIIKEYFNIPMSSLETVLSAAHVKTVTLMLQYYRSNQDTLQLPDGYLSTMVSVMLQTHVAKDENFFLELVPLLASASPNDIQAFPSLQIDRTVKDAINQKLPLMTLEQQEAFGLWYSKTIAVSQIIDGPESLVTTTGNLIAYLPFRQFQHLSSAQLMDGLDVLLRNNLTSVKKEFIAYKLIRNRKTQDLIRMGKLICLADPNELLLYEGTETFTVIQDIIMACSHDWLILPGHLISTVLLNSREFKTPSLLSTDRLAKIAHLLPLMGLTFLQDLTPSQLLAVLPVLSRVTFSPAKASVIVDKLLSTPKFTDKLQELGSLIVGIPTERLLGLSSDQLLSLLPAIAQYSPSLSPAQANAIASKLWGYPNVVSWLDNHYVDTLLYCTPLVSVLPRISNLVNNIENITTNIYNTQQAKAIFSVALDMKPNLIQQHFLSLGTLGQGMSCSFLKELVEADLSQNAVVKILHFLRQQPHPLHSSLKNCVIEELYNLEFFSQLLQDLGAELAVSMPVSRISRFSPDEMDILKKTILQEPHHFLLLPRKKQENLVTKMVEEMGMDTRAFTQKEFRSLGIMAPFVKDEIFIQMDRSFFIDNLNFLQGLCYNKSKMNLVALILQEPAVFGPVKTWNQTTLIQVNRFLFFLSMSSLQELSPALMTVGHIEKLFINQRLWERGNVGANCLNSDERLEFFWKQQFVLQLFLGFLRINHMSPVETMVPTCEILHSIPPAAWTPQSLTSMSSTAFSNCLELIGHDPFLESYQRVELFNKVIQMYPAVSSFSQSLIFQLGELAVNMSVEELSSLQLVERRSIAALGAISHWNNEQLTELFTRVLLSTKKSPSQLDSSTLVAMGYIVCGATTDEMKLFNALEFSKAALFLGQLRLPCSEEQLDVLVWLLSHRLAFGPISSWGTDVFIEIGVLAAGLSDYVMSALGISQIEGITPMAISMITPARFRVGLSAIKISMFSYEQAAAVTDVQIAALTNNQKFALSIVITPYENRPIDFRGRSRGLTLSYSPLCLTLGLLMLLTFLSGSDWP